MAITYDEYLKGLKPDMLGNDGRFKGPSAGVNYQAEGMTPEQFYARNGGMHEDPMARDGYTGTGPQQGDLSLGWRPGATETGARGEFWKALGIGLGGTALAGGFGAAGSGFSGMGGAGGAAGAAGDFGLAGTAGAGGAGLGTAAGTGLGGYSLGAVPEAMTAGTGIDLAGVGTTAAGTSSVPMTLGEQMASYGAGGGGITGGLATNTVGGFTGAAGGDLVGTAAAAAGGGGVLNGIKSAGSWLTDKGSLGGLLSPLQGLSSLYDMYASNHKSNALSDRYDKVNSSIDGYGAPGSPEYDMMKQELERKDAASGRNSQYGPRAVDLAARMAGTRMNAMVALNGGQNALLTQQQNQQYGGLNSLFGSLGQNQGNNSVLDSLNAWFKSQQQRTGT